MRTGRKRLRCAAPLSENFTVDVSLSRPSLSGARNDKALGRVAR